MLKKLHLFQPNYTHCNSFQVKETYLIFVVDYLETSMDASHNICLHLYLTHLHISNM